MSQASRCSSLASSVFTPNARHATSNCRSSDADLGVDGSEPARAAYPARSVMLTLGQVVSPLTWSGVSCELEVAAGSES